MPTSKYAYTGAVPAWSAESTRCGTPECKRKRGHGRTKAFCPSCANRLAGFRDELNNRSSMYKQRSDQRPKGNYRPRCCNPACDAPRPRGKTFCGDCEAVYGAEAA